MPEGGIKWQPITSADGRRARLAEYERELEQLRPEYDRAKALGPEYVVRFGEAIDKIESLLPVSAVTGEGALFLLGQITQIVKSVSVQAHVIADYEALRESARKLRESIGA